MADILRHTVPNITGMSGLSEALDMAKYSDAFTWGGGAEVIGTEFKVPNRAAQAFAAGPEAVRDLCPSTIVTNDLAQALMSFGDEFVSEDSAEFQVVVAGQPQNLHPSVRSELYCIACEALRNAFVHGGARHIEAEISYGHRLLRLRIRDDGQGIAPEVLKEGRYGHFGLTRMRERARQIGSKLSIWSGARVGTEIDLSIAGSIAYGRQPECSRFWLFRTFAFLALP